MTKISDPTRWALAGLALANLGIGLVLIGTTGLGPVAYLLRDIVGGLLVGHAIVGSIQAWYGKLYRIGEELLVLNAGLLAFAVGQIAVTGHGVHPLVTWGEGILGGATAVGCIILWGHLTGRRLGQEFRQAREARRKGHP